jgi:hypothetical protein
MTIKTASIVTDIDAIKQVLSPLTLVSCDIQGAVDTLGPGANVLIAVARGLRYPDQQEPPSASIVWGPEKQDPDGLVEAAENDQAMFLGHGLRDDQVPSVSSILMKTNLRSFVRVTQEVYGETIRCLRPFANLARYAQVVMYRGAKYSLTEK